ncbi:hypothetical protein [Paracoccus sp. SY]|uniref:hypothetical protein n=1 Tax=Paracoccus sp. SY TaxID=1330255 RepID=UPI000CD1C16C|nr:hypothetical protein [Paracoccus sp. SY]
MSSDIVAGVSALAAAMGAAVGSVDAKVSQAKASAGPGIAEYDSLAAAVAANPNGSVRINYDEQALPADFAGVLLEYTKQSQNLNIQQTGLGPYKSMRLLRGQFPKEHTGFQMNGFGIEMLSHGSGVNGPTTVENGMAINVAKKGFATGNAKSGAINCLYLFGRQDGDKGLPVNDPGRSDIGGVIAGLTIVEDAGWCGVWESTTTQINGPVAKNGYAAHEQMRQLQLAFGVIYSAVDRGDRAYGFSVVANKGNDLTAAFYAGKASTASWDAVLMGQDVVKIDGNGNYRSLHHAWPDGALNLERDKVLANGNATLLHRGTGALRILAQEGGTIGFGTGGAIRVRLDTDGALIPATAKGNGLGRPAARFSGGYFGALDADGAVIFGSLPVYADNAAALAGGLTSGRLYQTPSKQVMIV